MCRRPTLRHSPPGRQRGFLLIVAILLIVTATLFVSVMAFLVVSSGQSASVHLQSGQALFIAESGLERTHQQLASGTACSALTNTNVALGNGSFTTAGTSYSVTAGVTVVGGVTAAANTIPLSTLVGLAPHGRVRINTEEINYGATSASAAICGTAPCLVGARRGMAGTTAAAQAAGALVRQSLCLVRSTGTVSNAVRVLERTLHAPEIMMVYAQAAGDPNVYFRLWNSATNTWGAPQTATAVGAGNTINFLVLRFARTRNEAVLVTLDSSGDQRFQSWNGFNWSATSLLVNTLASSATANALDTDYRGMDVAYQTANDQAIIVHDNGATASPVYRTWNGTALSPAPPAAGTATGMAVTVGIAWPRWIDLAANPNPTSNNVVLSVIQLPSRALTGACQPFPLRALRAMVWNGAAWGNMGVATSWDTPTDCLGRHAQAVAYEQNSGNAMFAWGSSTSPQVRSRTWNGVALSAVATAFNLSGGGSPMGQWARLAPRFASNELMLGAQSSSGRLESAWWNGAAWTAFAGNPHSTNTESTASRNFDLRWEGDLGSLGSAQLVWGHNTGAAATRVVTRQRWNGVWGATTTSGDRTSLIQLFGLYAHNRLFAGIYESTASAADDIREMNFSSPATWSAPSIIWGGPVIADPVDEKVFIQGRRPILIEQQEIFP